jgi:hypothetical protein
MTLMDGNRANTRRRLDRAVRRFLMHLIKGASGALHRERA